MFDNCTTLNEMKALRASLLERAKSDDDIMVINNAYNKRRTELTAVTSQVKSKLKKTQVQLTPTSIRQIMFITGSSAPVNTMIFNTIPDGYEVIL